MAENALRRNLTTRERARERNREKERERERERKRGKERESSVVTQLQPGYAVPILNVLEGF